MPMQKRMKKRSHGMSVMYLSSSGFHSAFLWKRKEHVRRRALVLHLALQLRLQLQRALLDYTRQPACLTDCC